ncbi:hypothetical protein FQA47_014672 [Oryzias melastigma]|uniref:Uncharacterized protein n=1 Tax=Oryzias melastigma TaxID=30732 RepID=A0A834C254_ORYME|nr:hypothetical protein FQA47_014672 [Oryzias melastigma]
MEPSGGSSPHSLPVEEKGRDGAQLLLFLQGVGGHADESPPLSVPEKPHTPSPTRPAYRGPCHNGEAMWVSHGVACSSRLAVNKALNEEC